MDGLSIYWLDNDRIEEGGERLTGTEVWFRAKEVPPEEAL